MPTTDLRALEDPEPVLRLWDEMMRAIAELAAKPFPFLRPERIVADVQISAGGCSREGCSSVDATHLLFCLWSVSSMCRA